VKFMLSAGIARVQAKIDEDTGGGYQNQVIPPFALVVSIEDNRSIGAIRALAGLRSAEGSVVARRTRL